MVNQKLAPSSNRGEMQFVEYDQPCCIIGRGESDLQLVDERCSRQHALLYESFDGDLVIRDLDSRNGTLVNSEKITECKLAIADEIRIGKITLTVLDFHPVNRKASAAAASGAAPAPIRVEADETTTTGTGVLVSGPDKLFRAMPPEAQGKFIEYVDAEGTQIRVAITRLLKKQSSKT